MSAFKKPDPSQALCARCLAPLHTGYTCIQAANEGLYTFTFNASLLSTKPESYGLPRNQLTESIRYNCALIAQNITNREAGKIGDLQKLAEEIRDAILATGSAN